MHVYHGLFADIYWFQRSTPPTEGPENHNNQPHIIKFQDDEQDGISQYFICVEQMLHLESNNLISSILLCVAAHYVYNLSYHPKSGDVWWFIQEKILNLPSKGGLKKSPSSLTHFRGLVRRYDQDYQQ